MKKKAREIAKLDRELYRVCSKMSRSSVRISVPKAFLSTLTLFFHHASDAMAGDNRPDHGLAMMRQGREYYKNPFYFLYGKLKRAEKKMLLSESRKACELFCRYHELQAKRNRCR